MPFAEPIFWRFNPYTQQYQQTNTWFLVQSLEENYEEIFSFEEDNDNYSYITQTSENYSLTDEEEPIENPFFDFKLFSLYFDHRSTSPAA